MIEVRKSRRLLWIAFGLVLAVIMVSTEIAWTAPVREAVRCYTDLISAANRRDLEAARALCTENYLKTHDLKLAQEGGMVGLPRNIHKNFRAWREGKDVWLCPTNRVGPVFRFVKHPNGWKFDGVVGQLMPGGRVEPMEETE